MAGRRSAPPRISADQRKTQDDALLGDEGKRKPGFQPIDWASLDPFALPQGLINQFKNNQGAKKWAKAPLSDPLDDDTAQKYLQHRIAEEKSRADAERDRLLLRKTDLDAAKKTFEERVEERKSVYLTGIVAPLPQDEHLAGELAFLEVKMNDLKAEMSTMSVTSDDDLARFKTLDAIYQSQVGRYQQILKDQGANRSQRDSKSDGKTVADFFSDIMEGTRTFMDENMHVLVCQHLKTPDVTCKTELAWLWYAFEHIHDPLPYYAVFICGGCGGLVEIGDRSAVLAHHMKAA